VDRGEVDCGRRAVGEQGSDKIGVDFLREFEVLVSGFQWKRVFLQPCLQGSIKGLSKLRPLGGMDVEVYQTWDQDLCRPQSTETA
jgi:hypothetical protein